jgi:hypothetical protein
MFRRILAGLGVCAVGVLLAVAPAAPAQSAGLCASNGVHLNFFYDNDGRYTGASTSSLTAVRIGVQVREWRDCTTGSLVYTDTYTVAGRYGNHAGDCKAVKINSTALYREDGYLQANSGSAYAYINYRTGASGDIDLDTSNKSTTSGAWAAYGVAAVQFTAVDSSLVEVTYTVRDQTTRTPARYWWP